MIRRLILGLALVGAPFTTPISPAKAAIRRGMCKPIATILTVSG